MDIPFSKYTQIVGVPRLGVIIYNILLLIIAFADIDETVVQAILLPVVLPAEHTHSTTRMPWDIRNLVAILGVGRVVDFDGRLVGILRFGGEVEILG